MALISTPMTFRLLDLPPELRNRIYYYVFEDTNEPELELKDAASHMTEGSILSTSRQVYEETLSLFVSAMKAFWATHTSIIHVIRGLMDPDTEWCKLATRCKHLPCAAAISSLALQTVDLQDNLCLKIIAKNTAGRDVEWIVMAPPRSEMSTERLATLHGMLKNSMTKVHIKLNGDGNGGSRGLNVEACAAAFSMITTTQ